MAITRLYVEYDREQEEALGQAFAMTRYCYFEDNGNSVAYTVPAGLTPEEIKKEYDELTAKVNASIEESSKEPKTAGFYSDSKMKKFDRIYSRAEENKKTNGKAVAVGLGLGLGLTAATLGGMAYKDANKETNSDETRTATEQQTNNQEEQESEAKFNLTGKDWQAYFMDANVTNQKLAMMSIWDFAANKNGSEDWQRATLEDGEAVFGFTSEQLFSLMLRFGNYSLDDYVTLTGGKDIDVTKVMDDSNSMSNGALRSIIYYYVNSDKCDLGINSIINFNDKEFSVIENLESKLYEFKQLELDETKEKEAKAKMGEIESAINELAYSTDEELSNVKSYALRTILPAASIISNIHQYKFFNQEMMETLVLGNETTRSIADMSCGGQSERLENANEHIRSLRQENMTSEAAYAGGSGIQYSADNNNVETEFDKLTEDTFDSEVLCSLLDERLKTDGMYPTNMQYFEELVSKKAIEYKNTHGVTQSVVTSGQKGDKIVVEEKHITGSSDVVPETKQEQKVYEEAKKQIDEQNKKAEAEAVAKAEQISLNFQQVYDAIYNNLYSGTPIDASVTNSQFYATAYRMASEDVANRKNLESQQGISGGQTIINKEFEGAVQQQPVQTPTPTPAPTVTPTPVEQPVVSTPVETPAPAPTEQPKEEVVTEEGIYTNYAPDFSPVITGYADMDIDSFMNLAMGSGIVEESGAKRI